jgi:hypothetical protein
MERMASCGGAAGVEVMGRVGRVNARRGVEWQRSVLSWPGARCLEVEGRRAVRQEEGPGAACGSRGAGPKEEERRREKERKENEKEKRRREKEK